MRARRLLAHPTVQFSLAFVAAPVIAIGGEAFGGVAGLRTGALVASIAVALLGYRSLHREWRPGAWKARYPVVIAMLTACAALLAIGLSAAIVKETLFG